MNKHNHITLKLLAITFIFFIFSSSLSASKVYKWTDEDGTIHYSDIKPSNVSSENIKVRTNKSSGTRASAQKQVSTLNETKSQQLSAQAQKLQEETQKRENDARCQKLRDNLVKFKENSRIKINDNGTPRFLTPEEIAEKTSLYQKILNEECN